MLKLCSLIIVLICFSETIHASLLDTDLPKILKTTRNYFEKLKLDYELQPDSSELYELIDKRVNEYVKNVMKTTNLSRGKRQLDLNKDVGMLNEFKTISELQLTDSIDVTFFVYRGGGIELRWYAATLNSSGIFLFQYQRRSFSYIETFVVENGTRLISHSCDKATLLVVQRSIGDAAVIRMSRENKRETLYEIQTVETPEISHMTIWQGMKRIYLGVSSPRDIKIYTWLGEHFDRIQTISSLGAARLEPFQNGDTMHLIAIDRSCAFILKFLLRTSEFVIVQRLNGGNDATTFNLEKQHNGEHFIAIAGKKSTIVYKQSKHHHRFVPFQEISSADEIRSWTDGATILLFCIENGLMKIHQYDGWKFVESDIRDYGIFDLRSVSLMDESFLILRIDRSSSANDIAIKREKIVDENVEFENLAGKNSNGSKETRVGDFGNVFGTTGTWSFRKIIWQRKESWSSLRDRTKIWCQDSLKKTSRKPPILPQPTGPLTIKRGYIQTLRVREINGQSAEKFVRLSERWDAIVAETSKQKERLNHYISTKNPKFQNLSANNVYVNCTSLCRAEKIVTAIEVDYMKNLRRIDNVHQNLYFENVEVSYLKNLLPCPLPAPKFHDITVNGLVNGISFPEFVDDILKVTGDQELTASYTFSELRVKNSIIPLDVASNFTRQKIEAKKLEIVDLRLESGNFLLPLKNDRVAMMNGSLTVSKATFKGLVDIRKIRGSGSKIFSPMIQIDEPLEIRGNLSLGNVKIIDNLEVRDFTRSKGKSLKKILSDALPLNSESLPMHFKFRNDIVSWSNMTVSNFPYKWLTKKNDGHVVVTGKKYATRSTITLDESTYKGLPTPRLPLRLCGIAAVSEGIWESNLVIDRGYAETVKCNNVFDESEFSEIHSDSATSLDEIDWSVKNITGQVTVKQANIVNISGLDFQGLKNSMAKWIEPGHLRGPIKLKNLNVDHLITSKGLKKILPCEVGDVESKGNLYVETLNNYDYEEFIKNIVMIDDTISLRNVTFAGGLVAKEIFATKTSFSLQENLSSGYLGSKEIFGNFEAENIIVPDILHRPPPDVPVNIIVNGNVLFVKEPKIANVNGKNLKELHDEVWMTDRSADIKTEWIEFKNVTFENELIILKSFDTPNLGPWRGIENRLLSKTKSQRINVTASFNEMIVPNIVGSAKSRLRSNDPYLSDLEFKSLKNNETQVIRNKWHFEELIVTGNVDFRGRINGLNFATDVVRSDVQRNIVEGKKTFRELTARNIIGMKFDEFAANALRKNNGNRTIVIKGRKNFRTVEMGDISVKGTIMGRRIENSLLKSSEQTLRGTKIFQGSVTAPSIITKGLVNNIQLESLVKFQLKKQAPIQIIKTPLKLCKNLTIFGNLTIDGLYQGVDLKIFKNINDIGRRSIAARITELSNFSEGIEIALNNRAVYWKDLELVEANSTPLISDPPKNQSVNFDGLGHCGIKESSLYCEDRKIFIPISTAKNGSRILRADVVSLSGISLVVSVISDPGGGIFIYRYDLDDERFYKMADLLVPGIIEGSMTTAMDSLWTILRLKDHTMVLRYETWSDFQKWILPGNSRFLMSSTPTDELLLFRYDGVWKLGGLAGPRHILEATLKGQIDTFSFGPDYYVQLTDNKNITSLYKTLYVGN